jgi:hypothetical protein
MPLSARSVPAQTPRTIEPECKRMTTNFLRRAMLGTVLAIAAASAGADDRIYKLGHVWTLNMIYVEPGQGDEYLKSMKGYYTTVMEEAIKEKVIVSYKLLQGARANPQDFNFVILIESANWAAFDAAPDKFEEIGARLAGTQAKSDEKAQVIMTDRVKMRTVFGGKNLQEILFVK